MKRSASPYPEDKRRDFYSKGLRVWLTGQNKKNEVGFTNGRVDA
jgi:hypothetical protein